MSTAQRVLVLGGAGRLGRALVDHGRAHGAEVVAPSRGELDVTDRDALSSVVRAVAPTTVVDLASWTDLARCEADPVGAAAVHVGAVATLAELVVERRSHLCVVSTDFVFDGTSPRAYTESDPVRPLSVYGATKAEGERAAGPGATVVRTAWVMSRRGPSLVRTVLEQARAHDGPLLWSGDQRGSPTSADDLAPVLWALATAEVPGIVHAVNAGSASRAEVAAHVLASTGGDPARVVAVPAGDPALPDDGVRRPASSVLATGRLDALGLGPLRPWPEAVEEVARAVAGST